MLALIQRVTSAKVEIDNVPVGEIEQGLLVFLGVEKQDTKACVDRLLKKLIAYRVFADGEDKMNLSVADINGELLIVSQFTLAANTDKGLRPSFSSAKNPVDAEELYNYFVAQAQLLHKGEHGNKKVASGRFGADMCVTLANDGPVTFILR